MRRAGDRGGDAAGPRAGAAAGGGRRRGCGPQAVQVPAPAKARGSPAIAAAAAAAAAAGRALRRRTGAGSIRRSTACGSCADKHEAHRFAHGLYAASGMADTLGGHNWTIGFTVQATTGANLKQAERVATNSDQNPIYLVPNWRPTVDYAAGICPPPALGRAITERDNAERPTFRAPTRSTTSTWRPTPTGARRAASGSPPRRTSPPGRTRPTSTATRSPRPLRRRASLRTRPRGPSTRAPSSTNTPRAPTTCTATRSTC